MHVYSATLSSILRATEHVVRRVKRAFTHVGHVARRVTHASTFYTCSKAC